MGYLIRKYQHNPYLTVEFSEMLLNVVYCLLLTIENLHHSYNCQCYLLLIHSVLFDCMIILFLTKCFTSLKKRMRIISFRTGNWLLTFKLNPDLIKIKADQNLQWSRILYERNRSTFHRQTTILSLDFRWVPPTQTHNTSNSREYKRLWYTLILGFTATIIPSSTYTSAISWWWAFTTVPPFINIFDGE